MDPLSVLWYDGVTMAGLPPAALLVIVAALSALAGGVLTWLVVYLTRDRAPEGRASSSGARNEPSPDLLRVVATKSGPVVLIRGERRGHLSQIRDRETGEEAVAAVDAVLTFAEGWLPTLRRRYEAAVSAAPRAQRRGTSAAPAGSKQTGMTSARSASAADPLRMVEEIDALLQQRLAKEPGLAEQGIRLTRDVKEGILIYVGQDPYGSTEDIPDERIARFIRETIRIWESQ